ncbi:MAG: alpha/beta fold hydrolase [Hyphomicrobiales bacterium]|nr:alpha/beta fold hydrolase [Hyphomicrobiales bacterium]
MRRFWPILIIALLVAAQTALATAGRAQGLTATMVEAGMGADGPVRLHVVEAGRGRPIVLLHGIGGSAYSFRYMIPSLARTHRVVAIDLKGFGRSDKPLDGAYAVADHAAYVAAVMDRLGLRDAIVVGHSFGGAVALHLAVTRGRRDPGLMSRLVLMGTPAFPQPLALNQRLLATPLLPYVTLSILPPILATRRGLDSWPRATPPPTDEDAMIYAEPLFEAGGRHALIATTRLIAAGSGEAMIGLYPSVRQPALLIWCSNDPTVPVETGRRLAQALPRARLNLIDACAHAPNEEAPQQTLALIRAFLARPLAGAQKRH